MAIPYGIAPLTADCASLMRGDSLRDSSAYRTCMEPGANLFVGDARSRVTADTLHPPIPPDVAYATSGGPYPNPDQDTGEGTGSTVNLKQITISVKTYS
ncbi:hypothetical protein [Laspinema palackyanum]|uniref:hypothetical protein n=1 Tax=Laspinema palackyanum TaxID=3231601 RepID=UPI00349F3E02